MVWKYGENYLSDAISPPARKKQEVVKYKKKNTEVAESRGFPWVGSTGDLISWLSYVSCTLVPSVLVYANVKYWEIHRLVMEVLDRRFDSNEGRIPKFMILSMLVFLNSIPIENWTSGWGITGKCLRLNETNFPRLIILQFNQRIILRTRIKKSDQNYCASPVCIFITFLFFYIFYIEE